MHWSLQFCLQYHTILGCVSLFLTGTWALIQYKDVQLVQEIKLWRKDGPKIVLFPKKGISVLVKRHPVVKHSPYCIDITLFILTCYNENCLWKHTSQASWVCHYSTMAPRSLWMNWSVCVRCCCNCRCEISNLLVIRVLSFLYNHYHAHTWFVQNITVPPFLRLLLELIVLIVLSVLWWNVTKDDELKLNYNRVWFKTYWYWSLKYA